MSSRKGQVWSLDFVSAAAILSVILLLFILFWNSLSLRWETSEEYREMHTDALFAADALLTTPGKPESWEMLPQIDGNITSLGLVNGRNELNTMKVEKLVSENATAYGIVKGILGIPRYELGINITDIGKNTSYYEFGRFAGRTDTTVIVERPCTLNGTLALMRMEVWK